MHPIPNFKIYKAKSDRTKERDGQFLSHELPEHKDQKKKKKKKNQHIRAECSVIMLGLI